MASDDPLNKHDEIAAILHELRVPTQAIQGFLAIVLAGRAGPLNDAQVDFLSSASRASARLIRLIRDIDIVGSHHEHLMLTPRYIDLLANIEACIAELRPLADKLAIELAIEARSPDQVAIFADPDRVDQILLNLLENAIRHGTPEEPVQIRLRGGHSRVLCVIENSIPVVMERHDPDEPAGLSLHQHTARADSHGWGLRVVERLVHAHHGRVIKRVTRERVCTGFTLPRSIKPQLALIGGGAVSGSRLSESLMTD